MLIEERLKFYFENKFILKTPHVPGEVGSYR